MTILKTPVTQTDIRQVVQRIVERFRPRRVLLFGSYAKSTRVSPGFSGEEER